MDRWLSFSTGGRIKIMLACGLLQIAAYYFVGTLASPGTHLAVPQPDTLLYCQSARQIAEGTPYIFTPGDKPSTGSTSHLYPYLLAALYKAGATGDALLTAGFALNALFYLIFLANWGLIACRLVASPWAKRAACALLALNGQAVYCALAQSDVGLFMAVSSGVFVTLLSGRMGWLAALLVLAPWCRPEGVIFAVLFAGALIVRRVALRQRIPRMEWVASALAILSSVGVFVFNDWLTGYAQFQSVYYKGYFKQFDFLTALNLTVGDTVRMGRELFLGLPVSLPRECFFIPLLGTLFAWLGVMVRPWRGESLWKELWWLLACAAGVVVVASSGWQNWNIDRYFAWLLPIWLIYMAEGVVWVGRCFPRSACRALPFLVVTAFQAMGVVWLATTYYSACLSSQQQYDFGKEAHVRLPAGARVGGDSANLAYVLPGRRFVHLSGIYSPDLLTADPLLNLERLKHQPNWRFDFWALPSEQPVLGATKIGTLCGSVAALSVDGENMRRALWEGLDNALLPASVESLKQTDGWRLADRLDVGYPEDEKRCDYSSYSRFHRSEYVPFGLSRTIGTNELFEVGRVVFGGDSMTIRVRPRQPVRVVLRTLAKVEAGVRKGSGQFVKAFTFDTPLKLAVHVDGVESATYALPLSTNELAFSEVQFTVPAEAIRKEDTRLTLYGDHVVFGYWFYQPAQ